MKEKILIYDSSLGYGIYFEKLFKKDYEIQLINKKHNFSKIDLFYFDHIVFMVNEPEDVDLFAKIYSSNKGINLFAGITQNRFKIQFQNLQEVHLINMELSKTDIIKYINKKLNINQTKNRQSNQFT